MSRLLGTTIETYKGESFTLYCEILNDDGYAYALPINAKNPHIVLKVESNTFAMRGVAGDTYWIDVSDYYRANVYKPLPTNSSQLLEKNVIYYDSGATPTCYYRDKNNDRNIYKFAFKKTFLPIFTRNYIEQQNNYQISIATGTKTIDYLKGLFSSLYPLSKVPNDVITLRDKICAKDKNCLKDVDIFKPLVNYTFTEVILKPSKFIIKPNA